MKCDCSFIKEIDFFGKKPEFYLKGNPEKKTLIGRVFTLLYIIIFIVYFSYKFHRMLERTDITFYDTYSDNEESLSIYITKDNFYLLFSLIDGNTGEPFKNEKIYYAEASFYNGETIENIEIETCSIDKIGANYTKLYENEELDKFYCLKDINYNFRAYADSIDIKIFPCKNNTINNYHCEPKEVIDEYLNGNDFLIYMEDILITPNNFKEPVKPRKNFLYTTFFKTFGQFLFAEMQVVDIETNNNIIGLDFFTKNKNERYIRYDTLEIIPQPGYDLDDESNNYPVSEIFFQLKDKMLKEKRQYIQLFDVLGEVGGFMGMISSFFNLLCSFIVDFLYEKSVSNNLFSFDLKKKIISIKNDKKFNSIIRNHIDNIITPQKIKDEKIGQINVPRINFRTPKRIKQIILNEDLLKNSKDNNTDSILNLQKRNIVETNPDQNEKESNDFNKTNFKKAKINEKVVENNHVINYIKINDIMVFLCLCIIKAKKNLRNILLDESKSIISQKLDILNIFRNICLIEKIRNNFEFNNIIIPFSDECKKSIEKINNSY